MFLYTAAQRFDQRPGVFASDDTLFKDEFRKNRGPYLRNVNPGPLQLGLGGVSRIPTVFQLDICTNTFHKLTTFLSLPASQNNDHIYWHHSESPVAHQFEMAHL